MVRGGFRFRKCAAIAGRAGDMATVFENPTAMKSV